MADNVTVGTSALFQSPESGGNYNVAVGYNALAFVFGSNNIAIGPNAGSNGTLPSSGEQLSGSNNIYIGSYAGPVGFSDNGVTFIGSGSSSAVYILGISGKSMTGAGDAVYISSNGKLGTTSSSRRFKEEIRDMGDASSGLMKLRPVSFRHKPEYVEGPRTMQYGLIAEEVAGIYPDLVSYDPKTGQPQTVYYHLVNAMLLNEVQKHHKEITVLKEQVSTLDEQNKAQVQRLTALEERDRELSALKEQVKELSALVAQSKESSALFSKLEEQSKR